MSPRLVLLNAALLAVSGVFSFQLYREASSTRPLPPAPAPRAAQPLAAETGDAGRAPAPPQDRRALQGVIAAKNLFSASSSEAPAGSAAPATPPAARPLLHGVVLDDGKSRAYLEDPASKKVFGYAVGDEVGGGRIESILVDRVVIVRPQGPMVVMLRDPAKPRVAPPPPAAAPGAPGVQVPRPGVGAGAPAATGSPQPQSPGIRSEIQPAPPRTLQSAPPDFLRRRVPSVPGAVPGGSGG